MTTLSFGVTYPAGQYTTIAPEDYAKRVESIGFDSLWLVDNLASGTPGLECLTTLGYMAASSTRLTIGTSVLLLPLHNPVLLAHAVTTLDLLSKRRLILGIGVGDVSSHESIGSDRRTRGERCEEALNLMKELWTENDVCFDGRFYQVSNYTLNPKPAQKPHVPIWVGGFSPAALARASRHATGFICIGSSPSSCGETFSAVDEQAKALDRPALTRAVHAYFALANNTDEAAKMASLSLSERADQAIMLSSTAPHVLGTPKTCRGVLRGFIDAGVTHFILDPVCPPDTLIDQLQHLQHEVLQPLLHGD